MAASLQSAATFLQSAKISTAPSRGSAHLRSTQTVGKSFGLETSSARLTCSFQSDIKDFAGKCSDAVKIAGFALATSALVVSGASAEGAPKRLTYDEIQSKTYMEVKGTGTANQCPTIDGGSETFSFKPGKYAGKKFCFEPTSFTVKAESVSKNAPPEFQNTKLMTRLTYTLDEIEGPFEVSSDGSVNFKEEDGIDYAAVTVQLPGGERVPFLFTVKQLDASGKPDNFTGKFLVPSYRGSSFLDPKGRGGSTGYDNAVALPAGGRGDEEELSKENVKNTAASVGEITLKVTKSKPETGEVIGVFESLQPSDTDLGAKVPKDVKIQGVWLTQDNASHPVRLLQILTNQRTEGGKVCYREGLRTRRSISPCCKRPRLKMSECRKTIHALLLGIMGSRYSKARDSETRGQSWRDLGEKKGDWLAEKKAAEEDEDMFSP
ncbi:hypothetical protein YC2023_090538 [Brassica napus]